MGTHPNCPSRTGSGLLRDHLAAHPELIGDAVLQRFPDARNGDLPFLFKVLSIATALSIQAHPDKKLAEQLHKSKSDIYKGEWKTHRGPPKPFLVPVASRRTLS